MLEPEATRFGSFSGDISLICLNDQFIVPLLIKRYDTLADNDHVRSFHLRDNLKTWPLDGHIPASRHIIMHTAVKVVIVFLFLH